MVRRLKPKRNSTNTAKALPMILPNNNPIPLIGMILISGIFFCLLNVSFFVGVTHFQSPTAFQQPNQQSSQDKNQTMTGAGAGAGAGAASATKETETTNKTRIFEILETAGIPRRHLSPHIIDQLPTWEAVVQRLGPAPRIYGLDSCSTFQQTVPSVDAIIAPAGAFNSGTNLMAELLIANCYNPARRGAYESDGVRWQVNWGKHQPPKHRKEQAVYHGGGPKVSNEAMLPVVMIRDPYTWMQSLCLNRYATHWFHEVNFHCPNLIPNHIEREFLPQALDGSYKRDRVDLHHNDPWLVDNVMNTANFTLDSPTIPVYVKYKRETTNHASLAHMWNDWYHDYLNASFPRVMVRYEDLLFYAQEVTTAVCTCFGGKRKSTKRFHHIAHSAKIGTIHLNKTSLVDNMIRFVQQTQADRSKGMTQQDLQFARDSLAVDLMTIFAYTHPPMVNP